MAQIDQSFSFGDRISVEMHVGTPQASGTNPKPPSEAPIVGQRVVVAKQTNATIGSTKIVNPA